MNDISQHPEAIPNATAAREDIEIDLLRVVSRIFKGYKFILGGALLGAALSAAYAMHSGKVYTAEAVFLPPKQDGGAASAFLEHDDSTDLYLGLLASHSVAESVIAKVHLMDVYHMKFHWLAENALAGSSKFAVNKNALISISVTTGDPQLSAAIANAYLDALYKVNGEMSASASSHRREFFESQLLEEKSSLNEAELGMKRMQEKTGMMLPDSEAQEGLVATARLQASIEDAEATLSTLLTSSTDQNPKVVQLRARIEALQSQLHQQQASGGNGSGITPGIASTGKMPALMLDYIRQNRDLKESEALYETLNQLYEKSRLAALDPGPQLEVVDPAVAPEHKSGPPRTLMVIVGTFLGGLLGLLRVLFYSQTVRLWRKYREVSAQTAAR